MKESLRGLTARTLGRPSFFLPAVDSTNQWMREHASSLPHGTVCWTDNQTAGRGRLGRNWHTQKGMALAMSLLLRPAADTALLPLVCGMAATEGLEHLTGEDMGIKWPNDVVYKERKIGGILCENFLPPFGGNAKEGGFAIAGIGINLRQTSGDFESAGLPHAGSVSMLTGRILSPEQTAAAILNALEPLWQLFRIRGFDALREKYQDRCVNIGREVRVLSSGGNILRQGIAAEVAENGCLLVEDSGGIHAVYGGEVSIRGRGGYV